MTSIQARFALLGQSLLLECEDAAALNERFESQKLEELVQEYVRQNPGAVIEIHSLTPA